MIFATIILIFITLMLLPMRLRATIVVNVDKLSLDIKAKLWCFRVFKEKLYIENDQLKYEGSITGTVESIEKGDAGIGSKLIKSLNFEQIDIDTTHNICKTTNIYKYSISEILSGIALPILRSNLPDCRINCNNFFTTTNDNCIEVYVQFCVTLLSLAYTLIKEAK